jgi:hypothetical protein
MFIATSKTSTQFTVSRNLTFSTALLLEMQVFWDVTTCILVNSHRHFHASYLRNVGEYLPIDAAEYPIRRYYIFINSNQLYVLTG